MDSKKNIPVQVKNRVAWTGWSGFIVCGNTDYTITFTFDEEWGEATAKTARFKFRTNEGMMYTDQPFTGDTVAVPMLSNVREVEVGVYVGDLNTTTGATIRCVPSILCGSGEQSEYEKKRFDELMKLFNDMLHEHKNLKTLAEFYCEASEAQGEDFPILPNVVGFDRVTFLGAYLRYCSDGGVVNKVEEVEREGTKYLRLRFDLGPLVTNLDVPEFIDIPVALITERVEEVDGPGLVTNSSGLALELGGGDSAALDERISFNTWLAEAALRTYTEASKNTLTLQPDRYYNFGEVESLTLDFEVPEELEVYRNEYGFTFISGTTPTVLTLPSSVQWANELTIEANKRYEISIVDNIGLWCAVEVVA
jgi:hypothetical protein